MLVSMLLMTRLKIRRTDSKKRSMRESRNSIVTLKRCSRGGKRRSQKREMNSLKKRL
jgi:hypothetical protein